MKIYVVASRAEAQAFIEKFHLEKGEISCDSACVNVWRNGEILLFICGIGFGRGHKNAEILREILAKFQLQIAINFGTCGCADSKISLGSAFVFERAMMSKNARLICVDEPKICADYDSENGASQAYKQNTKVRLYDMESEIFARICDEMGVRYTIYKVVSDHLRDAHVDKAAVTALMRAHTQKIGEL